MSETYAVDHCKVFLAPCHKSCRILANILCNIRWNIGLQILSERSQNLCCNARTKHLIHICTLSCVIQMILQNICRGIPEILLCKRTEQCKGHLSTTFRRRFSQERLYFRMIST